MSKINFPYFSNNKSKFKINTLRKNFILPILLFIALIAVYQLLNQDTADTFVRSGKTLGVLNITDVILESEGYLSDISNLVDDQNVDALLVRIDSPGGAVGSSQEIYEKLKIVREEIPVYASMVNTAASGGYYVALGADKIYANKGTITGSIGVIFSTMNVQEAMEKIGVKSVVHKAGKNKDILSPFREATEEENWIIEESLADVHEQFKEAVLENRSNLDETEIDEIADGRIFSGRQALEENLIDDVLSYEEVILQIQSDIETDSLLVVYPNLDSEEYIAQFLEDLQTKLYSKLFYLLSPSLYFLN